MKTKEIPPFKVINWDFNHDNIVYYDVMPYLVNEWNDDKKKKHKLWAIWVNSAIESEDYALAMQKNKKMTYPEAKKANLSGKKYIDDTKMPETFEEFRIFVKDRCFHQFWGRCEYEVVVTGWPPHPKKDENGNIKMYNYDTYCQGKNISIPTIDFYDHKIDVYEQIEQNLDVLTKHFMEYIKG